MNEIFEKKVTKIMNKTGRKVKQDKIIKKMTLLRCDYKLCVVYLREKEE